MDKQHFRKACIKRLEQSPVTLRYAKDKKIAYKLEKLINKIKPKSILFYLSMPTEVSLESLIVKRRKKEKVFVPFIEEESFKMVEYRLPLEKNSFGIYEPKGHSRTEKYVDLIIVPVVGMDVNRQRVGFGKGMYDRFFARYLKKTKRRPLVIFVQREPCISAKKVCDIYDIRCDYYLSSKEIII